jgi:hypothetical protein
MKRLVLLTVVSLLIVPLNARPARAQALAGFDKLKTLVGEWEGRNSEGVRATATYQLVSGGTALMETLSTEGESSMVTMYTVDGDRLALTHYCAANNQPRMQTSRLTDVPQTFDFRFTGGTNLENGSEPHMDGLVVTFEDADHLTQKWTWKDAANKQISIFHFTRKR